MKTRRASNRDQPGRAAAGGDGATRATGAAWHGAGASELHVHRAVVSHLRFLGRKGVMVWHTPNGGSHNKVEAAKLASMGTLVGIPDLLILHRGVLHGLELKVDGGRPSGSQVAVMQELEAAGAKVAVATGLDAALAQLEAWGLLRGTSSNPESIRTGAGAC